MKKHLLLGLTAFFGVCQIQAQSDKSWSAHKAENDKFVTAKGVSRESFPKEFKLFDLNINSLRQTLFAVVGDQASKKATIISLPNASGDIEQFEMIEASNFDSALQAQFPEIRAYSGKGITDKYATVKLSISPSGIQTMVFRAGSGSEYMEPYSADGKVCAVFKSNRVKGEAPFTCSTVDAKLANDLSGKADGLARSSSGKLLTFRLAMSCTGEYATYHGGTTPLVLTAFNNTMTRVNGVYEKDLAIHMNLIATTTSVIYLNAATDPYGATDANYNAELQATLTSVIGDANYDIGHLVSAIGNNGNAGCIGCVCNAGKGSGFTTSTAPIGDNFDIDFVVHEMGHQFGGNHSFSHGNEGAGVNVEVGSGVTIMGYAGITPYDTHPHSIDLFHAANIAQIQANMLTKTCPVETVLTHGAPVPNAGADVTIPMSTPFTLTGSGTDPNGDAINFTWEQNDDGAGQTAANSGARTNKPTGPNWLNYVPTTNGVRNFPNWNTILANQVTTAGLDVSSEALSNVARTLNFRLTARDNNILGGQTGFDDMVVTVDATRGPLNVTSQNVANQSWPQGSSQTVTWTVNNTNTSAGGANVDILLSTDGGLTFPIVLLAATPNDGSQAITVPVVSSTNARIMVKASTGIFFNVNTTPILVNYTATTVCNTYTNSTPLAIPDFPAAAVTNTISVPTSGTLTDVNISLNVTHTWQHDVNVTIIHPDATPDVVFGNPCAGNNNFNVVLSDGSPVFSCVTDMTGTFSPSNPLSVFNGKPSNGTWTLSVFDGEVGDTGTLNSWSVEACTSTYVLLSNSEFEFENFSLYPNPNKGAFTVKFTSASSNDIKINVHDMRGRQVYENSFSNNGAFNQAINLDKVQSGVYLVSIIDGAKKTVKRIVIE